MTRRNIEDSELAAIFDWAQYHPILSKYLIHIENERNCSWAAGKRRKRKGVKKGVSDLFLPYPSGKYHGAWIELKGPKNTRNYKPAPVTKSQQEWLNSMGKLGYYISVCYGADEAIEDFKNYLKSC